MSRKKKRHPAPLLQGLVPIEELAAIIERAEVGAISAQESAKLKAMIQTFALLKAELQSKATAHS